MMQNSVPSRLSPQWFYGNSCAWPHDERLPIPGTNELRMLNKQIEEANISVI